MAPPCSPDLTYRYATVAIRGRSWQGRLHGRYGRRYASVAMVLPSSRSERARRDVLDVTAGLVAEVGVEAVTIEEVSARSGVAKTTIYRHWPSKPALVLAAVG